MKKGWEEPVCNFCKTQNYSVVYDNLTYWEYEGKFRIVKCSNCGLIYTSPRPVFAKIGKYYKQSNYFGRDIIKIEENCNDIYHRGVIFGPVYECIRHYEKRGRILEIGAGTGLMLSKYKELGWETDGVELQEKAVKYAKEKYGIILKQGDFLHHRFKTNFYDVVVMNGALEHLYNPLETLQKVYSLLKNNGFLVISVPNVSSLGRKIFGKNWFPWQPPRHLYHFSPRTLNLMLKKSRFKQTKIEYNYHLQNKYILFQSLRYSKSPKFKKKTAGGLINPDQLSKSSKSIKVKLGKLGGKIFAYFFAALEPYLKNGEIIIASAKK